MKNVLSFDIEDWFHPEIFNGRFPVEQWDRLESRVEQNTEKILKFLQTKKLKATFFVLGWVAEKYPSLVAAIHQENHEIASHCYSHRMVTAMTPEEFSDELMRSIRILQEITGAPVRGFRAPTFSITRKTLWAFEQMAEAGIVYDSSIFPIHHDRYGIPDAPRRPYLVYESNGKKIIEFPMTTFRLGGVNIPVSGGGYFRLYPLRVTRWMMKKCQQEGVPIIFYAHPWEVDENLPRIRLNFLGKIRHYSGIKTFLERLDRITDVFEFTSFRDSGWLEALGAESG